MPKYKVGEEVVITWFNGDEDEGRILSYDPSTKLYAVKIKHGGNVAHVRESWFSSLPDSAMRNSSPMENTDFKVGDKVRHIDDAKDGPVGIVKGVYGDGRIKVKFPGLMKGGFDGFKEEELVMANVKNANAMDAKFKVGEKVKAFHGTKEGKVLSVEEGMRGFYYRVQLGTLHGVPVVSMIAEKELVAANAVRVSNARFEVGKIYGPNSSGWLLKVTSRIGDMVKGMIGSSVSDFPKRRDKFYEDTYYVDGDSANEVIHTQYDKFKASKTVANSKVVANALISFEELLKKEGLSREEFDKMMKEMKSKGASAVHYMRGKDGRLLFKADGTTIGNGVARNIRAIPVDSKGKGIIERCKIRTADGEVAEVAYIDEDGYVYFEAKDGRIRGVPAKTVVRLNADTSIVSETAVNASDAATRKFKPNDLVEWNDYKGRHNSAYYFRDNGPDRVTVSIYRDGQGGFLEVPRAWITNSRARNAAGYVDASSVVLHPGDAVVFKAQYSSHKDDDEWLERNGDTVREVRGNEVKLGPSANDWAKKSDLMVWHNAACACNAKFKVGDKVWVKTIQKRGVVKGVSLTGNQYDVAYIDGKGGYHNEEELETLKTIGTNAIVRKAMNATALNYSPYAKGSWIHDDKGKNYTVVEEEHWGKDGKAVRLVTIRDEQTKQTKEVPTTELSYRFHMGEAESCRKCGNAALNFSPGDKVSIVDTDIRYGGDEGEVVRKDGFRYVVRLTSRLDKPEVTLQPNQLKAANAVANASDDAILRRCNQANIVIKGKMGNVHSIVYGSGWIYPLVSPNRVLLKVFGSVKEAEKSALVNAVATNAVTDWERSYTIKGLPVKLAYRGSPYDDIKATVEGGNRDWIEVARVSMSNPPSQAEAEKMVAPKWSRIKKTAPNAVVQNAMNATTALNWNYKNSYQFFCVDPSMKAPCILSGWDYREDAKEDAAELKELHIPFKIVSRRYLEQQGIDPNAEASWKKNRR